MRPAPENAEWLTLAGEFWLPATAWESCCSNSRPVLSRPAQGFVSPRLIISGTEAGFSELKVVAVFPSTGDPANGAEPLSSASGPARTGSGSDVGASSGSGVGIEPA